MNFVIDSMACDGCADTVRTAIRNIDPAAGIAVDLGARSVSVQSAAAPAVLQAALAAAGYPARTAG